MRKVSLHLTVVMNFQINLGKTEFGEMLVLPWGLRKLLLGHQPEQPVSRRSSNPRPSNYVGGW